MQIYCTYEIDPRDTSLTFCLINPPVYSFDVYIAFVQYFMTKAIVLVC